MSIRIFHQCGHNANWNIESFQKDGCGDGLIFSPVHQSKSTIESLSSKIKQRSFFDPQYYLPNSQKKKLSTYPFFPETITGGFATRDFTLIAIESAKQCIHFQLEEGFDRLVIPARYFSQMDPEYIAKQNAYSVHPFLQVIQKAKIKKPVFLTLPLTSHMIESEIYRNQILNWVTGFPEIHGVYVLAEQERPTKQTQSKNFINAYMDFLTELKNADLQLAVGYLNTESILYTLIDNCELTFGTFENTRIFSIDKFIVSDEERRGPKARIYLPGLLNWVLYSQAKEIMESAPDIWSQIYRPTSYGDAALAAAVEPTFNQPDLYKHHFICFYAQIQELANLSLPDRYHRIRDWIKNAMELNEAIEQVPLDLDPHGNGGHLQSWLDAVNRYYRDYIK